MIEIAHFRGNVSGPDGAPPLLDYSNTLPDVVGGVVHFSRGIPTVGLGIDHRVALAFFHTLIRSWVGCGPPSRSEPKPKHTLLLPLFGGMRP